MVIYELLPNNPPFHSKSFRAKVKALTLNSFIPYYNLVLKDCMNNKESQHKHHIWLADAATLLQSLPNDCIVKPFKFCFRYNEFDFYSLYSVDCPPPVDVVTSTVDHTDLIKVVSKYQQLLLSAQARNKDFNLSLADVRKLITRKTCYYTTIPFNDRDPRYVRTIDRKDSTRGYVKGNVVACTHQANVLKEHLFESKTNHLAMTPERLQYMLNKILNH